MPTSWPLTSTSASLSGNIHSHYVRTIYTLADFKGNIFAYAFTLLNRTLNTKVILSPCLGYDFYFYKLRQVSPPTYSAFHHYLLYLIKWSGNRWESEESERQDAEVMVGAVNYKNYLADWPLDVPEIIFISLFEVGKPTHCRWCCSLSGILDCMWRESWVAACIQNSLLADYGYDAASCFKLLLP